MGIDGIEQLANWEPPVIGEEWVRISDRVVGTITAVSAAEIEISYSTIGVSDGAGGTFESTPSQRMVMSQFLNRFERKK